MAVATAEIARLRRMTGVTATDYPEADLIAYIERYPLEDARGEGPWVESETEAGTLEENPDWAATYDLNAAAGAIWAEKAAALAQDFNFSADGGRYDRSQAYEQAMKQARFFLSRRSVKTITLRPEPLAQGTEDVDNV